MSRVLRKPAFAYVKTKAKINWSVPLVLSTYTADLRLGFPICKKQVFSWRRSFYKFQFTFIHSNIHLNILKE